MIRKSLFKSLAAKILIGVLLVASSGLASAQANSQGAQTVRISILKGPSGVSSAWFVSSPPETGSAKIEFLIAGSADIVTAKLVSGEIDAGVLPVNVAAKLYSAGVPLRAAAVVGNGMVKFLTNDPAIKSLSDLRGKSVAIAGQKATPDYLFRFLTSKDGLEAGKDYTAVYNLSYPEIAAALASGKIQYAVLPEPFATQALLLGKELLSPISLDSLWQKHTGMQSYPMSIFVVSKKLADGNRQLLTKILQSLEASVKKTVEDPKGTALLVEKLDLGLKAAVAEAAILKSNYVYEDAASDKKSIEALLSLFLSFEPASIGGKLPDQDFYLN